MAKEISRIKIGAPAGNVWDALTRPELVKQWQYGSELVTDWKPGGEIRFRNEWEGQVFEQWGTVQEIVPDRLIRYTLFAPRPGLEDKPQNYFVMSYLLEDEGDWTTLTIEKTDNRPGAGSEVTEDDEVSPVLSALKNLVEGN
ncbi:SRPBCC family protein [Paenibacillus chitinolyticus]|uniref:SRPBCC family protein n=1 Tax=Paenibacillus chitinolyticus TaxID=79263 RepID=UPI003CFEF526